jgi:hypothetical protein
MLRACPELRAPPAVGGDLLRHVAVRDDRESPFQERTLVVSERTQARITGREGPASQRADETAGKTPPPIFRIDHQRSDLRDVAAEGSSSAHPAMTFPQVTTAKRGAWRCSSLITRGKSRP